MQQQRQQQEQHGAADDGPPRPGTIRVTFGGAHNSTGQYYVFPNARATVPYNASFGQANTTSSGNANNTQPTGSRRRKRRTYQQTGSGFGQQEQRDPDYDRSLPIQALDESGEIHPNMTASGSTLATINGQSSAHGIMSSGELPSSTKQLYDPKTDPIPAITKPQAQTQLQQNKEESGNNLGKIGAGGGRGRNRDRDRRNRRRGDSDREGNIREGNATTSKANDGSQSGPHEINRRFGGKLYNPDSEVDELAETGKKGLPNNAGGGGRRRGRDRIGRHRGAHNESNWHAEPAPTTAPASQTRESGKIMLLKNPNSESASKSTWSKIVPQPEYRRDTREEVEQKVRSVYGKIVYLEGQCIEIDANQEAYAWNHQLEFDESLWWDLVRLHERLIEEYEEFLFDCHMVNATPAIQNLPKKYKIPSRLWKNGISKLIELLRAFLPNSFDLLVSFIYYTYKILTRLYEFIPIEEVTWVECLGDLARCRMAIETNSEDRKIWQEDAIAWYVQCSYLAPGVGRLYHHLAVCSEPMLLDQLYYNCKSLMAWAPFTLTRESMLPLFGAAFDSYSKDANKAQLAFARAHGIQFTRIQLDELPKTCDDFLRLVNRPAAWSVDGIKYAIANVACLYQYGAKENLLRQLIRFSRKPSVSDSSASHAKTSVPPADFTSSLTSSMSSSCTVASSSLSISTSTSSTNPTQTDDLLTSFAELAVDSTSDTTMTPELSSSSSSGTLATGSTSPPAMTLGIYVRSDKYKAGSAALSQAKHIAFSTLKLALTVGSAEHYPHIFAWMVFLDYIKDFKYAATELFLVNADAGELVAAFPWQELLHFLKTMTYIADADAVFERTYFPSLKPLCEDWAIQGLEWASHFPWNTEGTEQTGDYFEQEFDYDELQKARNNGYVGPSSSAGEQQADDMTRVDRILWLGFRLAMSGRWFQYNTTTKQFSLTEEFLARLSSASPRGQEQFDEEIDVPAG
ncbi:hypothetical protein POJ06DRAFT_131023 [Lipomyces tetrasporus]|uniref:Nonsense-mediated mRNA decay factor n=1 Tax=Lipomyces tetrasporus TaxID=54092 RepID=A0AAD7VS18_9ASCO|nr:uncharacterized protein POJ06DRAFT_131023 [Lipomyces tetrasporus]KAJ8099219.1 hypothetical protein POJ06DRAFT_131023 [Lipomyces tetrasporus]